MRDTHARHKRAAVSGLFATALFFLAGWYLLGYNVLTIFAQMGDLGWVPRLDLPLLDWVILETIGTFAFALFLIVLVRASHRAKSLEAAMLDEKDRGQFQSRRL